ncbi:hypothetical protein, variant [Exophiala sideris]|uniref:DUF8035 domain-containing protein n=1 Tax=Exophiala sideris TaxID=1016849 RepID=A0A0D1YQ47_9EURO|nr:hypothetical protein PV11_08934 [Exophiala sideris]KIV77103.1 hypothetical protein, variant [Exophiala sideris]
MTENRYRPSSPRRYGDPRASTGNVYASSFNTGFGAQPRTVVDPYPSARPASVYATGAARKTFLDDAHPSGGPVMRTEYTVRPRGNSSISSESRRPISAYVARPASPPRVRPVISTSSRDDGPRSAFLPPLREDRYLMPAASQGRHHHRHSSATRADQERLSYPRVDRQPEYHRRGGYNAHPYAARDVPLQDDGFSYTTPKEQFLQESSRLPPRRESFGRRERPVSIVGAPEYRQSVRRDLGPPPASSRVLDRIDRADSVRHSGTRINDVDDRGDAIPRRRGSHRAPVVHHYRDDGYTSARDDRESHVPPRSRHDRIDDDDDRAERHKRRPREDRDREVPSEPPRDLDRRERDRDRDRDRERDRERPREHDKSGRAADDRRPQRSRDSSPEQSGLRKHLSTAAAVAAGAGVVGLASKKARSPHDGSDSDDRKERKHRKSRRHRADDETSPDELADRVERDLKVSNGDRVPHERRREDVKVEESTDDREERHERRKHRHHRQKDRSERDHESDTTENSAEIEARQRAAARDAAGREPQYPQEQRMTSPGEDEDDRPRRVQLVEPGDKKEDVKPKGILKPPRAMPFPEDPHPEREGVAPLKDATKEGIPPNARWTKISRALVNPEALEKLHERFEERDDYVIVLRVITREEITKLAEKTKEIREARERQWQAELEERRQRRKEKGGHRETTDDDYSSDEDRTPLAIEPNQPAHGLQGDPRAYLAQQQQMRNEQPVPLPVPVSGQPGYYPAQQAAPMPPPPPPQGMPVPDIRVDPTAGVNYATNV